MSKLSRGARAHFQPAQVARGGEYGTLIDPLADTIRDDIQASLGAWELEIGFGKGRYLLRRAQQDPDVRLLGIELVSQYFRLAADRAHRKGLDDLVLMQGEALFILATWLPRAFAKRVHVYFPDPWPKAKHHRRRLFAEETLDLLLDALVPTGELVFASDHQKYAARVLEVLEGHPGLELEHLHDVWPDGPRTNYEAKYVEEGRPITRVIVRKKPGVDGEGLIHPVGRDGLLVAPAEAAPSV